MKEVAQLLFEGFDYFEAEALAQDWLRNPASDT